MENLPKILKEHGVDYDARRLPELFRTYDVDWRDRNMMDHRCLFRIRDLNRTDGTGHDRISC